MAKGPLCEGPSSGHFYAAATETLLLALIKKNSAVIPEINVASTCKPNN